ncbi:MAG: adenylyltransferase/cytidyltransferase family protein [Candidatus Diapherotrites archaeon]|nr:adenylyltransferase/cytidyltransferase family protein [Candidatus Diapherotrites archaeon]
MAFGTFDLLHPGHLHYLREAKALGDGLVVVVARDENVLKIKGKKPLNSEQQRLKAVEETGIAEKVVLGDREMRHWEIVRRFHPTVIALGYDQWPAIESLRKELNAVGLRPLIERISAFEPHKYKSSKLKKQ